MALTPPIATISRRGFLFGCAAAAFVGSRISEVVFASNAELADRGDVIVTVFLRGGWDVMNVVPPVDGVDAACMKQRVQISRLPIKATMQRCGSTISSACIRR
jgi:uncharacterized protein (DUF1501 family)